MRFIKGELVAITKKVEEWSWQITYKLEEGKAYVTESRATRDRQVL